MWGQFRKIWQLKESGNPGRLYDASYVLSLLRFICNVYYTSICAVFITDHTCCAYYAVYALCLLRFIHPVLIKKGLLSNNGTSVPVSGHTKRVYLNFLNDCDYYFFLFCVFTVSRQTWPTQHSAMQPWQEVLLLLESVSREKRLWWSIVMTLYQGEEIWHLKSKVISTLCAETKSASAWACFNLVMQSQTQICHLSSLYFLFIIYNIYTYRVIHWYIYIYDTFKKSFLTLLKLKTKGITFPQSPAVFPVSYELF